MDKKIKMFNEIDIKDLSQLLKNKKVYFAPHNDLNRALSQNLFQLGVISQGFIDSFKTGDDIFTFNQAEPYDYVVINSPKYWQEIVKQFQLEKIIIFFSLKQTFCFYKEYLSYIDTLSETFDILFLAYNKSNVMDASLVIRELQKIGYRAAILEHSHRDSSNMLEGLGLNQDIPTVPREYVGFLNFKSLVCAIDWADRDLILECKQKEIKTIGLIDGVEDFEDADYSYSRNAYETVEFVLVTGRNDMFYLKHKEDKCAIVGLPKMYNLWHSQAELPEKPLIVINLNFTYESISSLSYGSVSEVRDLWLNQVLKACRILNMEYVISKHHAETSDLTHYNVSSDDIYTTIRKSSLVVSRFSTVISEALALSKPVVYHNPHKEKVKIYKNPLGAFSMSDSVESLVEKIKFELDDARNVRQKSFAFLDAQFNIAQEIEPAKLAAKHIINITEKGTL